MPFEDLALMRVIPRLTIVEPSDPRSCAALVKAAAETYGCVYLRIPRKAVPYLYPENEQFQFGKAKLLKKGSDVAFVALGGLMVHEALRASESWPGGHSGGGFGRAYPKTPGHGGHRSPGPRMPGYD